jgi:electron transfer flavoprotein beta subunit
MIMSSNIIVTAKQVIDPEMPLSAFSIDAGKKRVTTPSTFPSVINGFDEYAVEAALRIKDSRDATVTVLSVGDHFDLNIVRKSLAMGADTLILCQDPAFANLPDSYMTALILHAAIQKIGAYDLIICGRQASDWDNAQTPLYLAEMLGIPCLPLGQKVDLFENSVQVEQLITDGVRLSEASLPALITVSNELGEPRYPTMRNIMTANRKRPTVWKLDDLDLDPGQLAPQLEIVELMFPERAQTCEIIEADDAAQAARKLVGILREADLI